MSSIINPKEPNFLGIYLTTQFGLTLPQILQYGVLFNLVSIPARILFGFLSDRLSAHQILYSLVWLWGLGIAIMTFSSDPATPLVLAVLLRLVFGSTAFFLGVGAIFLRQVPRSALASTYDSLEKENKI